MQVFNRTLLTLTVNSDRVRLGHHTGHRIDLGDHTVHHHRNAHPEIFPVGRMGYCSGRSDSLVLYHRNRLRTLDQAGKPLGLYRVQLRHKLPRILDDNLEEVYTVLSTLRQWRFQKLRKKMLRLYKGRWHEISCGDPPISNDYLVSKRFLKKGFKPSSVILCFLKVASWFIRLKRTWFHGGNRLWQENCSDAMPL